MAQYFPITYSKSYLALLRQILTYLKHAEKAEYAQNTYTHTYDFFTLRVLFL